MDKFLSSHFDSESPEYYPEDFQGAAPGDGVIYISSDDDMECASSASVDDLESLSDDDEVALLISVWRGRWNYRQLQKVFQSPLLPVNKK